jgi:hypothetical protein
MDLFVPLVVGLEVFGQAVVGRAVSREGREVDLVIVIPDQGTDDYVIMESGGEIHLLSLLGHVGLKIIILSIGDCTRVKLLVFIHTS